jgi:hypothetical protein
MYIISSEKGVGGGFTYTDDTDASRFQALLISKEVEEVVENGCKRRRG